MNKLSILKYAQEITNTYSATMRELRKRSPDKVKEFMKIFKKNFDQAKENEIDDSEQVALLATNQVLEE